MTIFKILSHLAIIFTGILSAVNAQVVDTVKVAALTYTPSQSAPFNQSKAIIDRYKKSIANRLEAMVREAHENGAELVVSPEFSLVGYPDIPELSDEEDSFQNREQIKPYLEVIDNNSTGASLTQMRNLAKELKIWLVIGLAEIDPKTDKYYNVSVLIDSEGKVAAKYRKINLFQLESQYLDRGTESVSFKTPFGLLGFATCFDIHFENPFAQLARKVDIMIFPTSWVGEDGMRTFQQKAKQFKVNFIAANHTYYPGSGVISSNGTVQDEVDYGIAYGEFEIKKDASTNSMVEGKINGREEKAKEARKFALKRNTEEAKNRAKK